MPDRAIAFGPFQLLPEQHLLLEGEKPIRLGSRALDILIALAERAGDMITKDELVAKVWPDTFVEEGNLRVHVATLRKALGDGLGGKRYVATIPGRGYRFIAPTAATEATPAKPPPIFESTHNLPALLTRLVGRSETVETLAAQVQKQRLVTVVGPGGIGKTAVALAVADQLSAHFRDSVRLVDFASVSDPSLLPSALAFVLGGPMRSLDPVTSLIASLKGKEMLLVLDSCEHVIDAAASLAEQMLKAAPGIHILATSREPLRANGERVHRLTPLGVPVSSKISASEALTFPAVQLFVERATANSDEFSLSDTDASNIADICRRLDGIPLAIELAAGCVDAFGIGGVAARLDDRFHLLTRGRRTALPRHQTLSATLDWSYGLLPESERMLLRRLAVFAGWFTMESASAVVSGGGVAPSDVVDSVANLAAKSLIAVDVEGVNVNYRLLESTRAYGLGKLKETGESEPLARRHAEYFRDVFERAETVWEARPTAEWLTIYGRKIDNVRAALDWAFSPGGDTALGVALTIAAVPLWRLLSLMDECRGRTQTALSSLSAEARTDTREVMKLLSALAAALRYDRDPGPEIETAWTDALAIADQLGDADYQLRAISGLRTLRLTDGNLREVLNLARRFKEVAARASDPTDLFVGDRMIGFALHLLGQQSDARHHIADVLRHVPSAHRSHIVRFGYDQRVLADNTLARILWLQGFPDQAARVAERNIEYARSLNHELSLCNALGQSACRVALLVGDLAAAQRFVTMLLDHAAAHELPSWHAAGRCYGAVLRVKQGDVTGGLRILRTALDELSHMRFELRYVGFLADLADACGRAGDLTSAHAAVDEARERCLRDEELWNLPEVLRVKGEILLLAGAADSANSAESCFQQSLESARRQGALSWELRTATSLARLWQSQGRIGDAHDQLAAVYKRVTEGFKTADLTTAGELLDELS
jgi:predicted ATPase/DNA-binding winged helix-turn-helix (wHTH) protein